MTASCISLPAGFDIRVMSSVPSTNDEACQQAALGGKDGTVIWAVEQRKGKGRRGRVWESPPGNLYLSILLRDIGPMAQAAELSFVAAVAMGEAVADVAPCPEQLSFKWPNDLLMGGRKFCGILLESGCDRIAGDWVVIGTGVNIEHFPADTAFPATSLSAQGCHISVAHLLQGYLHSFADWRERWRGRGFAPIRAAWLQRAAKLGEEIGINLSGQRRIEGLFRDLTEDGAIEILESNGNIQSINAGDVFFK